MNLISRVKRLESNQSAAVPLTEDEQRRLKALSEMDGAHPDYDVMETLELTFKSRPGLSYERWLEEGMEA